MSLNSEADATLVHDWARIAESSYNAYAMITDGKNYRGEQMPTFSDLTPTIQTAWQAAVRHACNLYNLNIQDVDALVVAEAGWKGWKPE